MMTRLMIKYYGAFYYKLYLHVWVFVCMCNKIKIWCLTWDISTEQPNFFIGAVLNNKSTMNIIRQV